MINQMSKLWVHLSNAKIMGVCQNHGYLSNTKIMGAFIKYQNYGNLVTFRNAR